MGGLYSVADLVHESANDAFERRWFKRRGNVFITTSGQREFAKLLGAICRNRHDRHRSERLHTAYLPGGGEPIELRHLHVHNDQVGRLTLGAADRLHAVLGLYDPKPAPLKPGTQEQTGIVEVIDNEHCSSGILSVGRVHVVLFLGGPSGEAQA